MPIPERVSHTRYPFDAMSDGDAFDATNKRSVRHSFYRWRERRGITNARLLSFDGQGEDGMTRFFMTFDDATSTDAEV